MNDLKNHLPTSGTFRLLYVDDLQIYVQVSTHKIKQGTLCLAESAKRVATWSEINCLALNTKKTQAIIFGSCTMVKIFKDLNITTIEVNNNGDKVPFVADSWRP